MGDIDDVIILKERLAEGSYILTTAPETMTFEAEGGQQQLSVRSNTSWSITWTESWCRPLAAAGNGSGSVTIEVDQNPSTDERTTNIVMTTSTKTVTVKITQKGAESHSGIPGSGDNPLPSL